MSDATWHFVEDGQPIGPVHRRDIERRLRNRLMTGDTLVWRQGMSDWEPAQAHFDLVAGMAAPNVVPSQVSYVDIAKTEMGQAGAMGHGQIGPDGLYIMAPSRTFGEAIRVCFSKFATFSGRASRSEYWYFVLFYMIGSFVCGFIDGLVFVDSQAIFASGLFGLVTFLPFLAVYCRRLHDADKSGWWYGGGLLILLGLSAAGFGFAISEQNYSLLAMSIFGMAGVFGVIWVLCLFVFTVKRGTLGQNRFG